MPATPPDYAFRAVRWLPTPAVSVSKSPFSHKSQAYFWGGQSRQVEIDLPPMSRAKASAWIGFFLSLNGPFGSFYLRDSVGMEPLGTATGLAKVAAGNAANSSNLLTKGWTADAPTILAGGDWFSISDRLYQATADVASDSAGLATVPIWPRLGATVPATDTALDLRENARGIFRLTEPVAYGWGVHRLMEGITFTAEEVIP